MNTVRSSFATASRVLALALALPASIVACAGTEASDATPTYRLTYAVGADGARSDTPQSNIPIIRTLTSRSDACGWRKRSREPTASI